MTAAKDGAVSSPEAVTSMPMSMPPSMVGAMAMEAPETKVATMAQDSIAGGSKSKLKKDVTTTNDDEQQQQRQRKQQQQEEEEQQQWKQQHQEQLAHLAIAAKRTSDLFSDADKMLDIVLTNEKPKRPCSVYNLFYQVEREYILQTLDPERGDKLRKEYDLQEQSQSSSGNGGENGSGSSNNSGSNDGVHSSIDVDDDTKRKNSEDDANGDNNKDKKDGNDDPLLTDKEPPRPVRYLTLVLAEGWYKSGKRVRKHRRTNAPIGFADLNKMISSRWAAVSAEAAKAVETKKPVRVRVKKVVTVEEEEAVETVSESTTEALSESAASTDANDEKNSTTTKGAVDTKAYLKAISDQEWALYRQRCRKYEDRRLVVGRSMELDKRQRELGRGAGGVMAMSMMMANGNNAVSNTNSKSGDNSVLADSSNDSATKERMHMERLLNMGKELETRSRELKREKERAFVVQHQQQHQSPCKKARLCSNADNTSTNEATPVHKLVTEDDIKEEDTAAGAGGYIMKPFRPMGSGSSSISASGSVSSEQQGHQQQRPSSHTAVGRDNYTSLVSISPSSLSSHSTRSSTFQEDRHSTHQHHHREQHEQERLNLQLQLQLQQQERLQQQRQQLSMRRLQLRLVEEEEEQRRQTLQKDNARRAAEKMMLFRQQQQQRRRARGFCSSNSNHGGEEEDDDEMSRQQRREFVRAMKRYREIEGEEARLLQMDNRATNTGSNAGCSDDPSFASSMHRQRNCDNNGQHDTQSLHRRQDFDSAAMMDTNNTTDFPSRRKRSATAMMAMPSPCASSWYPNQRQYPRRSNQSSNRFDDESSLFSGEGRRRVDNEHSSPFHHPRGGSSRLSKEEFMRNACRPSNFHDDGDDDHASNGPSKKMKFTNNNDDDDATTMKNMNNSNSNSNNDDFDSFVHSFFDKGASSSSSPSRSPLPLTMNDTTFSPVVGDYVNSNGNINNVGHSNDGDYRHHHHRSFTDAVVTMDSSNNNNNAFHNNGRHGNRHHDHRARMMEMEIEMDMMENNMAGGGGVGGGGGNEEHLLGGRRQLLCRSLTDNSSTSRKQERGAFDIPPPPFGDDDYDDGNDHRHNDGNGNYNNTDRWTSMSMQQKGRFVDRSAASCLTPCSSSSNGGSSSGRYGHGMSIGNPEYRCFESSNPRINARRSNTTTTNDGFYSSNNEHVLGGRWGNHGNDDESSRGGGPMMMSRSERMRMAMMRGDIEGLGGGRGAVGRMAGGGMCGPCL